ncbi:hypothetical protein WICMUC_002320 [Wickerhamomyces mucosus]|uniref:Ribosome biogenesis protein NOP53 n=1 Tax=Wickerhamomyces mucosus TaxID=1378264 RepID=A0A9P8TEN6_9ASCO|nr:hypothetical protein WICMUC_002320 [Wickerhamomyces mucosus]
MEVNRPSQKKQPSRKGKKAWRKNIDIDDVEIGLEEQREQIRTHGETVDTLDSEKLFTIDTQGDEKLQKKSIKPYKVLKSTEILNQRSKAQGFTNPHKKKDNKIDGVKKKEIHRLMKLAGRVQNESSAKAAADKDGILNTEAYDVWGTEEPPKKTKKSKPQVPKPDILEKLNFASWTPAKHAPKTIKVAPLKVKDIERVPAAGKSYNPSLESWKSLINVEFKTEKEKEDKRLELEAYKKKVQKLIETLEAKEEEEEDNSEDEDENDDEENNNDNENAYSLSINKPVVIKKKTKTQRNKQKRHQEKLELESELKSIKTQIRELEKVKVYEEEINNKQIIKKSDRAEAKVARKHKLGTRFHVMEDMLEVKLSDELTDSLRGLKTEGNLLYDQVKRLQGDGKIETRLPVKRRRRYNPKITEKWTYKDLK